MKIAIIGAGIAGLSAARPLKAAGHEVVLFDKGRGPGGRLSTRRAETPLGECRWDHGAQYFTARSPAFRAEVERLVQAGQVSAWAPDIARIKLKSGERQIEVEPASGRDEAIYVGAPAMNSLIKALAEGLSISWGRRVSDIEISGGGKSLVFEDGGREGSFDTVICAIPAEQAAELLQNVSPELAREAGTVRSAPCWAVMLAFDTPLSVGWDGAKIEGAPLSWAARNSAKPGRGGPEAWVLHASPDWSRANVDAAKEEVASELTAVFLDITGAPEPVFTGAHRWLLAMVETSAGSPYGWDDASGIAAIGDWRIAPRIEAAWQSGHSIAEFLLR